MLVLVNLCLSLVLVLGRLAELVLVLHGWLAACSCSGSCSRSTVLVLEFLFLFLVLVQSFEFL